MPERPEGLERPASPPGYEGDPGPVIEMGPALTWSMWSDQMVSQSLEVLLIYLAPDGAHSLKPIHAESLQLGWTPKYEPGEVVVEAARSYGLEPLLAHSTSWRFEKGAVVLTYVVVVAPLREPIVYLSDEPVARSDLARGDEYGRVEAIGVDQVTEHALRHLAWLVKDDEVVGRTLTDWTEVLDGYEPEPFRSFAAP